MGSNILPLTPGTFYIPLRQDFILLCQSLKYRKDKSKSSPHCKALILAILERWTNDKIDKNKNLFVHMTFPQWEESMYNLYKRNVIADSLDELLEEKLIQRATFKTGMGGRDQYKYLLNIEAIKAKLATVINHSSTIEEPGKITDQQGKITVKTGKGTVNSNSSQAQGTVKNHHGKECTNLSSNTTKQKESTPLGSTSPNVPACTPSSTSLLENLTEEERAFWQLWCSRSFNKIAPKLNATAYTHVQALAPHITTDEQIDSLIAYSKKKLEKRGITDGVKLGNMNSDHNDWLQTRPKPKPEKDEPPASKEKLILWTRTQADMENVEKFKHTRRGKVDEWEALRDSINWEWVTEDEARQHGWEEGRGFTDRERRELFAAKEAKELILWTEEPDHLGDPVANWYKYKMMTRGEAREKYKLDYYDELPAGVVVDIQHKFKLEELGHIKRPVLVS